jgi:predicted methyltransferase
MKRILVLANLLATASISPDAAIARPRASNISAVADITRPISDRTRDDTQHAVEMLEFAGVKDGQAIADMLPGGGYWTRLFSRAVGRNGRVYSLLQRPVASAATPNAALSAKTISSAPSYANVSAIEVDFTTLALPQKVGVFGPPGTFVTSTRADPRRRGLSHEPFTTISSPAAYLS